MRHTLRTGWAHRAGLDPHRDSPYRRRAAARARRVPARSLGAHDTAIVASVLPCMRYRFRFFVTSRVYYRYIVAMRRTDLVLYCGILNLGLDIVLNLLLMHWFGVAGIALPLRSGP